MSRCLFFSDFGSSRAKYTTKEKQRHISRPQHLLRKDKKEDKAGDIFPIEEILCQQDTWAAWRLSSSMLAKNERKCAKMTSRVAVHLDC